MPELAERMGMRGRIDAFERPTPKGIVASALRLIIPLARSKNKTIRKIGLAAEREYFKGGWAFKQTAHNLIVNTGYYMVANRTTGLGTYSSSVIAYFAWGDGTTTPTLARTAADFYSDCANDDTKAITTVNAFDVGTLTQKFDCFLTSTDNAVTTIKKFTIMNADPGTVMFCELLLSSPITKNAYKEFYFRYSWIMSQVYA